MSATTHSLEYNRSALAYLKKIQLKYRHQIIARIRDLGTEPCPRNCKVVQNKMHGGNKVFRIRSGDYRILYVVRSNPPAIVVLDIGHRKNVYR